MTRPRLAALPGVLLALATAAVALAAGCSSSKPSGAARAAEPTKAPLDPATVVATVGDERVTLRQVDELVADELEALQRQFARQQHDVRRKGLERYTDEKIVNAEMKRRGMPDDATPDALLTDLVAPTDAEVKAFFEEHKEETEGQPFEALQDRIRSYLHDQRKQEGFGKLLSELRRKAGVTITLPEIRVPVATTGPSSGPADAPVTIVEFADFECPYCTRGAAAIKQVLEVYGDKVRVVFVDYPLEFHANAGKASEAAHCAGKQGRFWELHDALFANQSALDVPSLKGYAKGLGLDVAAFDACLDGGEMAVKVEEGLQRGQKVGVNGTPAFFVNGIPLEGAMPFESFKELIDRELARLNAGAATGKASE